MKAKRIVNKPLRTKLREATVYAEQVSTNNAVLHRAMSALTTKADDRLQLIRNLVEAFEGVTPPTYAARQAMDDARAYLAAAALEEPTS